VSPRTADGLTFEVAGSGPPLLLIHAGIADRTMWEPQWERWRDRFTLIRYDQRGFGESADPGAEYLPHDDALSVLEAAGYPTAAVIGCSFGAWVAIDLALAQPSAVDVLVATCGFASGTPWGSELEAEFEEIEEAFESGGPEAANELELRLWLDGTRPAGGAPAALREAIGELNLALLRRQDAFEHGPATPEPPAEQRLGELALPLLAISGEHDQPWMREQASRLAGAVDGASAVEIAGAAHLPSLEQPLDFERAVLPFLQRHARTPRT
jgi:pimeloyl-ACP methyl ester carboxylesterase